MTKHRAKDGLVSKVRKVPNMVFEDENGKYIPYCSFNYHKGVIKDESVCISRNCRHYEKYRLEYNHNENDWKTNIRKSAKEYYNKFF
jgi:hypothetical protein